MDIRAALIAAENKALALLGAIEAAGLIAPGKSEAELDAEIFELARARFGVETHWHKRIVRAGANTLCVFADTPPLRVIEADDLVCLDLGPVFAGADGEWEADVGRTYVLGSDAEKHRLVADLPRLFDLVKAHYETSSDITGAQLYAFAQGAAAAAGWRFGGVIAGHIVGEFPHARRVPGARVHHRIAPANKKRMRDPDDHGNARHWILEIHLVDTARSFGGFYERLL